MPTTKIIREKERAAFKSWLSAVPVGSYKRTVRDVCEACHVPYHTFANWRDGKCRIPQLAQEKIEGLAMRKIFTQQDVEL